jgi:hypothetical protein
MTDWTQQALKALKDSPEEYLYDYLVEMIVLHPSSFLELVHLDHMLMIEELRDEKHNGYSMYPELDL